MEDRPHSTSEWAEVKGSAVHGRGMFATQFIPEGAIYNPIYGGKDRQRRV